jgi:8-oxo-dGTP diphosphatase
MIEPGETPEEALRRELAEEFGVDNQVGDFIASARHVYHEELTVELLAYRVRHVSGEFRPQDHDALAWVAPEELPRYALCPADLFILEHL